jgi:hypothetical protein
VQQTPGEAVRLSPSCDSARHLSAIRLGQCTAMTRLPLRFVLVAAALLAAPAAHAQGGQAFHDPATGLRINLPAPFELAGKQDRPNYDVAVAVKSATGAPRAANADGSLCGVAYARAPSNDGLTQAEINAVITAPAWLANAKTPLAMLGKVEAAEIFSQTPPGGGSAVRGGEFIIAPSASPGAENTRMYLSMWETPQGRVVVSCAGLSAEMPAALEAFRTVRKSVSLGR